MFEIHITLDLTHRIPGQHVANELEWKTSAIDGDPLLGDKTFFYLTRHRDTLLEAETDIQRACTALLNKGILPLRVKVEEILFDTKTGLVSDRYRQQVPYAG